MKILKARPSDSERMRAFFNETLLSGDIEFRIRRTEPQTIYELFSQDFSTYLLLNDDDEIEAMATLAFHQGRLLGEDQMIGFATDLRVSTSRRAILSWSQHFLPILEEEKQSRNCKYVFSVVSSLQRQAYNAFIRPRLTRRHLPRYHLFRTFDLISIHGILPFAQRPLDSVIVKSATSHDAASLADYIVNRNRLKPMAFTLSPKDVIDRWARWPGLKLESFLIAIDSQRNIVGCVAPWSADPLQTIETVAYHGRGRVLHDSLRTLSWVINAHRLPRAGQNLNVRYLTHFNSDNPDVAYSLIYQAFNQSAANETLSFAHFNGDLHTLPARSFIGSRIKAALYFVQPPESSPPEVNYSQMNAPPPEFELPWM